MRRQRARSACFGVMAGALLLAVPLPAQDSNVLAIVVNKSIKTLIQTNLDEYVADVTSEGYWPVVKEWDPAATNQNEASELRAYLQTFSGLTGAVFVGTVPTIEFRNANDFSGAAVFPFDLYFMDLTVNWQDTNSPPDGRIDLPTTSGIQPTIWVSRIKCGGMNVFSGATEADLTRRYFGKVHRFRTGQLRLPDRALQWADTDWEYAGPTSTPGIGYAYTNCTSVREALPNIITDRTDWEGRWPHGYESEHFMCHSSESLHQPGGNVVSSEIAAADIRRLFWNCWNCSSGKYTYGNYIAGVRLYTPQHGLVAVASTKTGSMLSGSTYYSQLNAGVCHGVAFLRWFAVNWSNVSWHRGMTLLGDGTLRLGRFACPPNPTNNQPTLAGLSAVSVAEDTWSTPMAFTIGDAETAASNLIVWADSNNRTNLPSLNTAFGGSNETRTISVKGALNVSGGATVTVCVCDGQAMSNASFLVTITPVNDPPVCTLTDPRDDHDVFLAGGRIPLQATVTDTEGNGTVTNVEFLLDGAFVCRDRNDGNTTYTGAVASAAFGGHAVRVVGYDNAGGVSTSAAYSVRVVTPLASPWISTDIGTPGWAGVAGRSNAVYVVAGGGDIDGGTDKFHFACLPVYGNGEIVARLCSIENTDGSAKAGVMVRAATKPSSRHALARVRYSNYAACMNCRLAEAADDLTVVETNLFALPKWVRLVKQDSLLTAYVSTNGTNWASIGSVNIDMPEIFYAGLAAAAKDNGDLCTVEFDNVTTTFLPGHDGDGDNMPDGWEIAHFGATNAPNGGADDDPDGDGLTNRGEFTAGTDPNLASSTFVVWGLEGTETVGVRFLFDTVNGRFYWVEFVTNILSGDWSVLAPYTNLTGTGGPIVVTDTNGAPARYYRVRSMNP